MKHLILIILTLYSYSVFSQSDLFGTWNTNNEDNTTIEISESKSQITGKIKSSDNPQTEIGTIILKDFKKDGNRWKAKLYAPKRGKWYDAIISPKGQILEIEISVGFLSKTLEWKKS